MSILTKNQSPPVRLRCQCLTLEGRQCERSATTYRIMIGGERRPTCGVHGLMGAVRYYKERGS